MGIDVKSSSTDRAKITKSTARGPPTLEDLDAEMDDYFEGRQEFVEPKQEVGRMTIQLYLSLSVVADAHSGCFRTVRTDDSHNVHRC